MCVKQAVLEVFCAEHWISILAKLLIECGGLWM
jgi:hypothetical protein